MIPPTVRRPRRWRWVVAALVLLLMGAWFAARVPDLPPAALRAKYTTAASQFITIEPGLSVHVRDEGPRDGLPIVLLHGSSSSLQTWEPWVKRLKGRYRVITFDQAGHGLTGPHPRRDYGAAAFVRAVDEVARAKGLGKFVLGGNSMGGWVAWNFAVAHPERLAGLILVDAAGAPAQVEPRLPIGFRIARTPVLRDLVGDITPRSMVAKSIEQTVGDPRRITPATIDRYWELLRFPGNREATIDRFSTPRQLADPAALRRFEPPVLIVWGSADKLIPVDAAGWFSRAFPHARVAIFDGLGHVPMEEDPDRSIAPVLTFLDGLAPQTTAAARTEAR